MKKQKIDETILLAIYDLIDGLNADYVYLFGSRLNGYALPNSDVDILIISNIFENLNIKERVNLVYSFWNLRKRLQVTPMTAEEVQFEKNNSYFIGNIFRIGIKLERKKNEH